MPDQSPTFVGSVYIGEGISWKLSASTARSLGYCPTLPNFRDVKSDAARRRIRQIILDMEMADA